MKIGLTGGMGCGKSTATKMFAELGCRTLDSDRIVRDELLVAAEVVQAVVARFGESVLTRRSEAADAGAGNSRRDARVLDRAALAAKVFATEEDRLWLETLLHPRVEAVWAREVARAPDAVWVIEVPLLFEKGFEKWFDFTVCVTTTPARQLARLAERGITHALAAQRISQQLPLAKKIEYSDFVLSNDGSSSHLREQIAHLISVLAARV